MLDAPSLKQFNKIYDDTYNKVLKYIICKCSNIEDVNDIIQETYLEVYKSLIKEKNIDNFDNYIIGIAKNKIKKHYSIFYKIKTISLFESKDDNIELLDNIESNVNIEQIVLNTSNKEFIWNYLKKKKIIIQRIFYLYYELNLKIKEISKELKVSESYVKNSLYRTLKELQELLGKDCD